MQRCAPGLTGYLRSGTPYGHFACISLSFRCPRHAAVPQVSPMKAPMRGRHPEHHTRPAFKRERAPRLPTPARLRWTTSRSPDRDACIPAEACACYPKRAVGETWTATRFGWLWAGQRARSQTDHGRMLAIVSSSSGQGSWASRAGVRPPHHLRRRPVGRSPPSPSPIGPPSTANPSSASASHERGMFVPAGLLASSARVVPRRPLRPLDQVILSHRQRGYGPMRRPPLAGGHALRAARPTTTPGTMQRRHGSGRRPAGRLLVVQGTSVLASSVGVAPASNKGEAMWSVKPSLALGFPLAQRHFRARRAARHRARLA